MRRLISLLVFVLWVTGSTASPATFAQDVGQGRLHLRRVKLTLKTPKADKPAAHSVKLSGNFLPGELTLPVDPTRHDIRLLIDGVEFFRLPAANERDGLERRSHGRWRYKQDGVPGRKADKLDLDLPRGRIKVRVKGRDLTAILNHGPRDLNVALELNGQLLDVRTDFSTSGRRWSVRNGRLTLPPGGAGSLPPDAEPRDDNGRITSVILDAGELSRRTGALQTEARNDLQWRILWGQHRTTLPPYVDFSREMILAVFLGDRPTSGYSVVIESVSRTGEDLIVQAVEGQPGSGCIVAQAFTAPYVLVRVPRVPGTVDYDLRTSIYTCAPR